MRERLDHFYKKANSLRVFVLVCLLLCISVSFARAVVPAEVQRLLDASAQDSVNADKFVGGVARCTQTGCNIPPFSSVTTIFSNLIVEGTGATQTGPTAYRLGPPLPGETYLSYTPGATGSITNYIAMMSGGAGMPKASEYFADLIQNSRFGAQPAYAQGLGFSALTPVLGLWKLFRNIAYFFFVVIFLVVGMMIMFRTKIGSQTAVTVQQALPKMVVALLLVTFSYAIAGLMIEVMYLVIYLGIAIFQAPVTSSSPGLSISMLTEIAFKKNFISNVIGPDSLMNGSGPNSGGNGPVGTIANALGEIVIGALNVTPVLQGIVQNGANLIFTVVIAFALLASIFRVFFALIQSYIQIFFAVIFSPIILLIGALPGQNTFGPWLKGLLENLLVFPVIIFLIFIGYYFTRVSFAVPGTLGFSPPQLGSNQGTGFQIYSALIPFAAILAMPDVIKITKGILKGQLDLDPFQLLDDARKRANKFAGATIPATAGIAGAGIGALQGGIGGLGTKQPFRLSNIWGGYTDPTTKKRVGGIRGGFSAGLGTGNRIARGVDDALELKFADPNSLSRLVEGLDKQANAASFRQQAEEDAKKVEQSKRNPA